MPDRWVTHKFGGTSLAGAEGFAAIRSIIETRPGLQAVVVSAAAGFTDELIDLVGMAIQGHSEHLERLADVGRRQTELIMEVAKAGQAESLIAALDKDLDEIRGVLRTSTMTRSSVGTADVVAGYGEVWSVRLLSAYLMASGVNVSALDARDVLVVRPSELAPAVDWDLSQENLDRWLDRNPSDVLVVTGYVAADPSGVPTTLGRNGSDYSASIFGALLDAAEIAIWTDVDGVLSADPHLVPDARVLDELSYNEAMELAYFGARVIHPATMAPAIENQIPVYIRNTFNRDAPGTRIHLTSSSQLPAKGFATINGLALLNLEGTAMVGVPGISERLFGALGRAGVSVIMISQGSSEHSICFAIPEHQADEAAAAVEFAFASEWRSDHIQTLDITPGCTILAVVGDTMSGTPGVAANFFGALARAGVNVKAIAQGASERNISVVIDEGEATRALRAVHTGFYLSRQTLSIGLVGPGHVGATFLDQLAARKQWINEEFGVDLRVRAICGSKNMVVDEAPIALETWRDRLLSSDAVPTDLDGLAGYVHTESVPHAVIIDCTASEDVGDRYLDWLSQGIHVITPNKKANTGSLAYHAALRDQGRKADSHYLYETTVGAALPILQTLRDLVQTGDEIYRIEGILSGTLSYLFNSYDGSVPFSKIVEKAMSEGYTEPDPREDLSGMDVARKVVILGREMRLAVSLEDLEIDSLVPAALEDGSVVEFLDRLPEYDQAMDEMVRDARSRDEVLRFVGVVDSNEGCSVSLRSYPSDHAFSRIRLTDNIVQFRTRRYRDNPLVVQGPGAGPEVTAGGVFADLLRLASYLGATL